MKKSKKFIALLSTVTLAAALLVTPAAAAEETEEAPSLMNPPVVEVEQGSLRGYMDGETYAFLGVPYATSERFGMPEEVEPWEGVRDAQTYGPVSPIPAQTSVGADEMVWPHRYWIENEEECENLNIWTQSLDTEAKRPVLVFFHGGGQKNGSSIESAAYEGTNLSEYGDVVVVTVNHRLNALGYMDLSAYGEEYANSAVAGIADLVAALQWIHDNIEVFGGDPENVTIFGQSGGGTKVAAILHCPEAEGLVQQAIIQSGGDSIGMDPEVSQSIAATTMDILGIDDVEELKTVPVRDLVEAADQACTEVGSNWGICLGDGYISEDYCDWAADVPVMVSGVFSENSYPSYKYADGRHNEWTEEELDYWLADRYGDNADAVVEEFQKLFPDMDIADACFFDTSRPTTMEGILERRIDSGAAAPVYAYYFTYEAPVNGGTTAFHCSDLIYVFHNVTIPIVNRATGGPDNEDALKVQDTVANAIINFAETGDPSQDGLEWMPYTPEEKNIMRFDVESSCSVMDFDPLIEAATAEE